MDLSNTRHSSFDTRPLHGLGVWVVMLIASGAIAWSGYQLGDRFGLLIGFFIALTLDALVLFSFEWRVLPTFPSQEVEGRDPWGMLLLTKNLCREMQMSTPRLRIFANDTPTAFSAGIMNSQMTIFVSSGLLSRLSLDELKPVFALELMRIKTSVTKTATAASALGALLWIIASVIDMPYGAVFRPKHLPSTEPGPIATMLTPIFALLARLGSSRKIVFDVDTETAEVVGRELLAKALWKLDSYNKTIPVPVTLAEAPLFIVSPLSHRGRFWSRFTCAHPEVEDRIRRLVGHYPI